MKLIVHESNCPSCDGEVRRTFWFKKGMTAKALYGAGEDKWHEWALRIESVCTKCYYTIKEK